MINLKDRMKNFYEERSRLFLTKNTDVILRLDGKAFHTYTKGFKKPYDSIFHSAMNDTALYLAKQIQGCKIAYTQSDEITLLLTDYDTVKTDAWFDYNIQKMCSVAASMATAYFNDIILVKMKAYCLSADKSDKKETEYIGHLNNIAKHLAFFDCRAFSIPHPEVVNYFIWRQQDCKRNAVQMLGQCYFSHKELQGKTCENIIGMLKEKGIDFENMPAEFKKGVCCLKSTEFEKKKWYIDNQIPDFTANRNYILSQLPIFQ